MNRLVTSFLLLMVLALLVACGGTPTSGTASSVGAASPAAPVASAAPSAEPSLSAAASVAEPSATAAASIAASEPVASAVASVAPSNAASAQSSAEAGTGGELLVFAAASLTDAFGELGQQFDAANGSTTTFNFAGSNQLAQQIVEGAPADVFASANNTQMNVVIEAGDIVTGTQRTFVRNRLVVIHPADNPAQLSTLQDLAKPGLKLVLAAKEVPVGQYALDFLAKASELPDYTATYSETVIANVVSYEENVRAVLSKVSLGEADAGIVYTSDVAAAEDEVGQIEIPDELNTIANYPIAPTATAADPELAQKFVDYVLSPDGQQILVEYGFLPTTGDAGGAAPGAVPVEVSGLVDNPRSFTADDLAGLETKDIRATDRGGAEQSYTGATIASVLEAVGVQAGAQSVVFIGGDGYSQELTLADLEADPDAIITIDETGSLRNILPTQLPRTWVKGLVSMEIK